MSALFPLLSFFPTKCLTPPLNWSNQPRQPPPPPPFPPALPCPILPPGSCPAAAQPVWCASCLRQSAAGGAGQAAWPQVDQPQRLLRHQHTAPHTYVTSRHTCRPHVCRVDTPGILRQNIHCHACVSQSAASCSRSVPWVMVCGLSCHPAVSLSQYTLLCIAKH